MLCLCTGIIERKKERELTLNHASGINGTGVRRRLLTNAARPAAQRESRRNLAPRKLGPSHVTPDFDLLPCWRSALVNDSTPSVC